VAFAAAELTITDEKDRAPALASGANKPRPLATESSFGADDEHVLLKRYAIEVVAKAHPIIASRDADLGSQTFTHWLPALPSASPTNAKHAGALEFTNIEAAEVFDSCGSTWAASSCPIATLSHADNSRMISIS